MTQSLPSISSSDLLVYTAWEEEEWVKERESGSESEREREKEVVPWPMTQSNMKI